MKELWKYIVPSFFSDKIAKQAPNRGVGSVLLASLFAVIFLALGLVAAYTLPFKANFNNTSELVATTERAFSEGGATLEINNGVLCSDRIIDTVSNENDRKEYFRGYDIIVDTRNVDTFDDFYAYCVTNSGSEISYEEYLEKDADVKTLYTFKIKYSGVERVIDDEWINKCESYLDTVTDASIVSAYAEVKNKPANEYAAALYNLYVKAYYPPLTAYERDGTAPKTRNYYYFGYGDREKIIFVFCDAMVCAYLTDFGAKNTFYGYYAGLGDGKIGSSVEDIKQFVYKSVGGASAVTVYSAVMGFFSVAPFIVLVVIALSVALFCLTKLLKVNELNFGAAAKTVCSFITVAALISALITFALGFLVSQSLLAWLEGVVLFAVIAIRMVVMLICSSIERKREDKQTAQAATEAEGIEK